MSHPPVAASRSVTPCDTAFCLHRQSQHTAVGCVACRELGISDWAHEFIGPDSPLAVTGFRSSVRTACVVALTAVERSRMPDLVGPVRAYIEALETALREVSASARGSKAEAERFATLDGQAEAHGHEASARIERMQRGTNGLVRSAERVVRTAVAAGPAAYYISNGTYDELRMVLAERAAPAPPVRGPLGH
jgi:hypothetical protein